MIIRIYLFHQVVFLRKCSSRPTKAGSVNHFNYHFVSFHLSLCCQKEQTLNIPTHTHTYSKTNTHRSNETQEHIHRELQRHIPAQTLKHPLTQVHTQTHTNTGTHTNTPENLPDVTDVTDARVFTHDG